VDVSGSLDLLVRNVTGKRQTCSVQVIGPPIVTASTGSLSLAAGETTTLTLNLSAGRSGQTPSGDYDGDVVINCGSKAVTLRVPWWVRIERSGP
jgi:hypothetical protein